MIDVFSGSNDSRTLAAHFTLGGVDVQTILLNKTEKYLEKDINKKGGGKRKIRIPNANLKKAQAIVMKELEKYIHPQMKYMDF